MYILYTDKLNKIRIQSFTFSVYIPVHDVLGNMGKGNKQQLRTFLLGKLCILKWQICSRMVRETLPLQVTVKTKPNQFPVYFSLGFTLLPAIPTDVRFIREKPWTSTRDYNSLCKDQEFGMKE